MFTCLAKAIAMCTNPTAVWSPFPVPAFVSEGIISWVPSGIPFVRLVIHSSAILQHRSNTTLHLHILEVILKVVVTELITRPGTRVRFTLDLGGLILDVILVFNDVLHV